MLPPLVSNSTQRIILGACLPAARQYSASVSPMTLKIVLWTLAAFEGVAVSRRQLATAAGCGLLTVDRAIKALQARGIVAVVHERNPGKPAVFSIDTVELAEAVDLEGTRLIKLADVARSCPKEPACP